MCEKQQQKGKSRRDMFIMIIHTSWVYIGLPVMTKFHGSKFRNILLARNPGLAVICRIYIVDTIHLSTNPNFSDAERLYDDL